MSRIPDETIESVRDAADIVALIGESVNLKRVGSDFRGPCPFHGGTHRNFSVSPKRGWFHCFVCHEKGDVFSYLMKRQGLDYPSAVREVARRVGITVVEDESAPSIDPREPLFQAVSVAHDWFMRQLIENREATGAREYLQSRDLSLDTAQDLELGYAPSGKAFLVAMQKLGLSETTLIQAGLTFQRDDGTTHPRFRGRIMFPISDGRGRVVGFGGRLVGPGEPKYLNSPETPVFRKGSLLYHLHQAKNAIRKHGSAIIVEGYFDALRLVLAGVENVVAPLGTALTADQAALLGRQTKKAFLAYDSDPAGLRATFRSGDELLKHGVSVLVATLPPGEDPDSLVRKEGAAKFAEYLRDALDLMERKIHVLQQHGWLKDLARRRSALDKLLPTISAASDSFTRDLYIGMVATQIGVSRGTIEAEIAYASAFAGPPNVSENPGTQSGSHRASKGNYCWNDERNLVHIVILYPDWRERARTEVSEHLIQDDGFREIYRELLSFSARDGQLFEPKRLTARGQMALRVVENSEAFAGINVDQTYVAAWEALEARPLVEQFKERRRTMRSEDDQEVKQDLLSAITQIRDEIADKYPAPWAKHCARRGWLSRLVDSRADKARSVTKQDPSRQRHVS